MKNTKIKTLPRTNFFDTYMKHFLLNTQAQRMLLGAFTLILLTFAVFINFTFLPSLELGEKSPRDIKAVRNGKYLDKIETSKLKVQAEAKIPKVYKYRTEVNERILGLIAEIFNQTLRTKDLKSESLRIKNLRDNLGLELSEKNFTTLVNLQPKLVPTIKKDLTRIVNEILESGVREDTQDLDIAKEIIKRNIQTLPWQKDIKELLIDVANVVLIPNKVFDEIATAWQREESAKKVRPVYKLINAGEIIIRQGEVIKPHHLEKLQSLGMLNPRFSIFSFLGIIIFNLSLIIIAVTFLNTLDRSSFHKTKILFLLSLLTTASCWGAKLFIPLIYGYPALIHLFTASFLATIFINPLAGLILGFIISLEFGLMTNNDFYFTLLALTGCVVASLGVIKITTRGEIARAGLWVALSVFCVSLSLSFITDDNLLNSLKSAFLAAGTGIFASLVTIGEIYFIEKIFRISTPIHLLELQNPNEPLLRRLLLEAPGTYHHSMYVANLAEEAANVIGGNAILAKVGAYYHDVGKISNPTFFIENQFGMQNIHEQLDTKISTSIIRSHVEEGEKLARSFGLPEEIINFTIEHHGTGIINYFYYQALKENEKEVNENDFRYTARKPQTKETALVMLADAVEGAVRSHISSSSISKEKMENIIKKIINDKLQDGQLEECLLSFKDLTLIKDSFLRVLIGLFHNRIEYPQEEINNEIKSINFQQK